MKRALIALFLGAAMARQCVACGPHPGPALGATPSVGPSGPPQAPVSAGEDSTLESAEPPEDATPDQDFESDSGDSLERGELEMGYAFAQRAGGPLRRRQRFRVREAGLEARVREGREDQLSGASLGTRLGGGWLAAGRAIPQWARGLVIGTPRDPTRERLSGEGASRSRGAAGDGIEFRREGSLPIDLVAQRVRRTSLVGASLGGRGVGGGVVVTGAESRPISTLGSLWSTRGASAGELALDARGRWRAEAVLRTAERARFALTARLGHQAFQGAVPSRAPRPAVALGSEFRSRPAPLSVALAGALWRFRSAASGARGALEVRAVLPQHDVLVLGLEERHGVSRLPTVSARAPLFRQGVWLGWRGGSPRLEMAVRHELWSARSRLRGVTRRVASASFTARPLRGCELSVSAAVFRARSSEPQYLEENDVDRRVLRSLRGAGRRTRLQAGFPAAGGHLRAALTLVETGGRAAPPQWTLDWSRRARTR